MQDVGADPLSPLRGLRRIFSAPRIDRELVADFFMVFARAEYALKRARYVEAGRAGEPRIKWDEFGRVLGDRLFDPGSAPVAEAISYLMENPPSKHIIKNGHLEWRPRVSAEPRDAVFLIRSITTVRNNLFHGGKEIQGLLAERDRRLVRSSLVVLAHALTLLPEVWHAFEELPPEHEAA